MTLLCICVTFLTCSVFPSISSADEKREEKPRFKGVELYSWKNNTGEWTFALLDGTNRLKTEQEVKEAKTNVKGVKELTKAIGQLAMKEQVMWTHPIDGFDYPPKATRKLVEKAAKDANVDLHVALQKSSQEQVQKLKRLWHEDSNIPIKEVPTPEGFKISPANAYFPLRETVARPQWLQWYLYADSKNYYIVVHTVPDKPGYDYSKPVGKEILQGVPKQSIVISGATGEILGGLFNDQRLNQSKH